MCSKRGERGDVANVATLPPCLFGSNPQPQLECKASLKILLPRNLATLTNYSVSSCEAKERRGTECGYVGHVGLKQRQTPPGAARTTTRRRNTCDGYQRPLRW